MAELVQSMAKMLSIDVYGNLKIHASDINDLFGSSTVRGISQSDCIIILIRKTDVFFFWIIP